jgi:hypothetical protein
MSGPGMALMAKVILNSYPPSVNSLIQTRFARFDVQKRVSHYEQKPGCILIADGAGKKVEPGETVKLQVRFPNRLRTNKFKFTRPAE